MIGAASTLPVLIWAQPSAPRQAATAPDLSGMWNLRGSPTTRYWSWTFSATEPPMTPWAQEKFNLTKPSFGPRSFEDSNDPVNPTTLNSVGCFPPGVPRIYLQPFPMEIIQTPGRVIEFFEFNHFVRQIWTDGRPHNTALGATWMGDSVGQYEGDTLVVDTVGVALGPGHLPIIDRYGTPRSGALHVIERYRLIDGKAAREAAERQMREDGERLAAAVLVDSAYTGPGLQLTFTVEDPGVFTTPWSALVTYRRTTGPWLEQVCAEGLQDYYAGHAPFLPVAVKPDF